MTGQFDLKWQPVQASDSSRLLAASQEATDAYSKAIKDQIKVFDTMFNNAQQHKMNEVQQAVNALTLEQYNDPNARAKFDESITNAFKDIGGINAANQLTMDTVWDTRGDTLTDRKSNALNLENQEYKVGELRDTQIYTNFGNTTAAMDRKIDEVSKLPQSEQRDTLLNSLKTERDNYVKAFEQTYPNLMIKGMNAAGEATTSILESERKRVDTENSFYDSMVNGMYPQFSAYAEARKEVLGRYTDIDSIEDTKEKTAKIAERDSALTKVDTQFKDVGELLKDPRMMAALNKKWEQELAAAANDSLQREQLLARIEALRTQSKVAIQTANTDQFRAEVTAAEVAAGITQRTTTETEKQNKQAAETNRAAAIASAGNIGISENTAKSMLGADGRVDNTKAVSVINSIGKGFQEDYNLGAPKGSNDFMAWKGSEYAQSYVTDFNIRVKANPKLLDTFSELSKGLSGTDTTLLYMGIARLPSAEIESLTSRWTSGTTRERVATSIINQSRKTWKDSYMMNTASLMSKHIDWVASQQGMTNQEWMQANRNNLTHALAFQSSDFIGSQLSPMGVDNWRRIPPSSSSGNGNNTKTGDIARNRVGNSKVMSGGR